MSLKTFKLQGSEKFRGKDTDTRNERASRQNSTEEAAPTYSIQNEGAELKFQIMKVRLDPKLVHIPVAVKQWQTCKCSSPTGNIHRSRWMCSICEVALCLSESKNCLVAYHSMNQA